MTSGHVAAVMALALTGGLAGAACARKPAHNTEAGQVAAAPVAPAPSSTIPTTEEGCRACNGVFGPHGIDPAPRCVCRTKDAGKKCHGKADCEGDCIGNLGDREVTAPGPPPRGFWVGRCAELRTTFGCHTMLDAKPAAPVRLDEAPQQLCVD